MSQTLNSAAVAALLALSGCGTKPESPPPTASAPAGSATATMGDSVAARSAATGGGHTGSAAAGSGATDSAAAGSAAAGSGDTTTAELDVPTKVDFEDEASAKITDKNVEAQVLAMEKQLEQK